jgi:aspartokinase-like uncharacterized kinase
VAALADLTVLKVGGSLSERGDPRPLMRMVRHLAPSHPLVLVPGGAEFAEAVRRAAARYTLSDETAHRMALLAVDQYGLLLAELAGAHPVTESPAEAAAAARAGRLPVLLPGRAVLRAGLPASWAVTSDTIAAWLCGVMGAARLVLLKDVDGLLDERSRLLQKAAPAGLGGVVDEAFSDYLPAGVDCWIINGLAPERLEELFWTRSTIGTEVHA